jgi:peptidoglycan/LPS O-acetylase OafA/YrhL
MPAGGARRFDGLQQLRLIAAAMVAVFHSAHYVVTQTGTTDPHVTFWTHPFFSQGVYLFFGISGFVLQHALTRYPVPQFLSLRLLRIYPPFLFCVALYYVARTLLLGAAPPMSWRALTLLPFGRVPYPLGIEWSLVYEIFFYVVVALLALPRRRIFARTAFGLWAALTVVASIEGTNTHFFPTFANIGLSLFNLCFIGGALAYEFRDALGRRPILLAGVALAGLVGMFPIDMSGRQFLMLPLATTGIVALAARDGGQGRPVAWWRAQLVRGGDWSYGLYLLHIPIITILLGLAAAPAARHPRAAFFGVALMALTLGLAYGALEMAAYRRVRGLVLKPGDRV